MYLKVELDPAGGTSYINMGTSQLLSAPYALYSEKTAQTYTGGTGINVTGTTITNTAPDQTVVYECRHRDWHLRDLSQFHCFQHLPQCHPYRRCHRRQRFDSCQVTRQKQLLPLHPLQTRYCNGTAHNGHPPHFQHPHPDGSLPVTAALHQPRILSEPPIMLPFHSESITRKRGKLIICCTILRLDLIHSTQILPEAAMSHLGPLHLETILSEMEIQH